MSERYVSKNTWIENENGEMIAIFPENVEKKDRVILENSLSAIELIKKFVKNVNENGVFKPRTQVKEFEQFLNRLEV